MKKTKSNNMSTIPDVDKKMIQNILEKRQKIQNGVKMIEKFLGQSSSKLNVNICCFIAKKAKTFSNEMEDIIKKFSKERDSFNTPNCSN